MERRVNYLLVGAFSLVMVAGLIAFVLWAHNRGVGRSLNSYAIYFDQTVNGLALGSVVRYLGVDTGQVKTIEIDGAAQPPRVRVVIGIDSRIPINQGTVAELKPSGITGTSFIDLRNDPANTAPLLVANGQMPVIRAESSGFDRLFDGASDTMQKVNILLSDDNLRHVNETLKNLDNISRQIDKLLSKNEKSLNRFLGPGLEELDDTIHSAHTTIDSIGQHPSQLVFGK